MSDSPGDEYTLENESRTGPMKASAELIVRCRQERSDAAALARMDQADPRPAPAAQHLCRDDGELEHARPARRVDNRACRHDGLLSRHLLLDRGLARLEFPRAYEPAIRSAHGL